MLSRLRVLIAVVATPLAFALISAPSAQADEESFVKLLRMKYVYLTPEQLLTEGYRVCQAARSGIDSSESTFTVYKNLAPYGASMAVASDIVGKAVSELGC
jgi:hypothetical protein